MAVADLYQVTVTCETEGNVWQFIRQYQQISGTNDADTLEEFAIQWNSDLNQKLVDVMSVASYHRFTDVYPVTENNEIPGSAPPLVQPGTLAEQGLPSNMAAKGHFITNAPNSKFNGSVAISGVPTSFQTEGRLEAVGITAYQTFLAGLIGNVTGVGSGAAAFQPVVISRYLDGVKRVTPVPFAIVDYSLSSRIGNMRRRTTERRQFPIGI